MVENDQDTPKYKDLSWFGAREYCRNLSTKGGFQYDLISFDSEEEYNSVLNYDWSDLYKEWKKKFGIWVGLGLGGWKGKKAGWKWSDGSSLGYANPNCPRWKGKEGIKPWRSGEYW